ncbi:caspase-9 isoform X1 [Carcharodon carcharias]|uniref:caspase-9 isoform X1 n=1 Tax=Carcharodon carcharias TaxID=13397 RepID=UPI001B7DE3D0|nr:caspase-9 isoform X1 [Carcharodon carcharias]
MNALQRKLLQRHRVHLVTKLKPELIYDFLVAKGVFTDDMIEEVKNSGTRRDQARQLVIDLQTRGTGAFPAFLESLQATGQHELLDLLQEELPIQDRPFTSVKPVEPQQGCQSVQQEIPTSRPIQCSDTDLVFPRTPTPRRLQDDMIYKMDADPCGYCLIINNIDFIPSSGLTCRSGSDIDCENVQNLFKKLHFDVIVKRNLTKHLIVEELKSLACKDHTDFDCCIVVILSHGSQAQHRQFPGAIFGVDGGQPVPVQHIVSYFDGSHSPTLREKPKLFFIQACGGDLKDTGFKTAEEVDSAPSIPYDTISLQTDATPCLAEDEPDAVSSLPTPSDILVSYSTYPGYVSWRHKKEGSWYMKALVHVISKYAHSDDLQTLLMRVTRSISENEEAKGKYKQIPGSFNFLRKHFYFFNKEKQ